MYVHCKAGRTRSATVVAAYLIQVRLHPDVVREQNLEVIVFWWSAFADHKFPGAQIPREVVIFITGGKTC